MVPTRSADCLEFVDDLSKDISSFLGKRGGGTGLQGIIENLKGQVIYNRPVESDREKWADALGYSARAQNPGKTFPPRPPMSLFGAPSHSSTFQWPSEKDMCLSQPKDVVGDYVAPDELLKFSSCYESANLKCASYVGLVDEIPTYDLVLDHDVNTNGHTQWYNFAVRNHECNRVRFRLVNFCKAHSLYRRGMQPVVWSERDAHLHMKEKMESSEGFQGDDMLSTLWHPAGECISYHRNAMPRARTEFMGDDTSGNMPSEEQFAKIRRIKSRPKYMYTFSFEYTFEQYDDVVFFTYTFPYSYTMCRTFLTSIQDNPAKKQWFRRKRLCHTIGNVECDFIGITNWAIPRKEKKVIVVIARVHPGESNSSWIVHGLINFLLGNNPEAQVLRDHFLWKIVPMLNPDGVICGNYRCSLAGVDLNRQWRQPDPLLHRTVYEAKKQIHKLKETTDLAMFLDLHGHSRKFNCFAYSCSSYPRDDSRYFLVRMYPKLISMLSTDFAYNSCNWKCGPGKRGTGRIVVNKDVGLDSSYTIEASFFGSHPDPRISEPPSEESEPEDPGSPVNKKKDPRSQVALFTPMRLQKLGADLTRALILHHHLGYEVAMIIRARQQQLLQRGTEDTTEPAKCDAAVPDVVRDDSPAKSARKKSRELPPDPTPEPSWDWDGAGAVGDNSDDDVAKKNDEDPGEFSDCTESLSGLSAISSPASASGSSNSSCASSRSSASSVEATAEREEDMVESSCVFSSPDRRFCVPQDTAVTSLPPNLGCAKGKPGDSLNTSTTASSRSSPQFNTAHIDSIPSSNTSTVDSAATSAAPSRKSTLTGVDEHPHNILLAPLGEAKREVREDAADATPKPAIAAPPTVAPVAPVANVAPAAPVRAPAPSIELRSEYSEKTYEVKKSKERIPDAEAKKKKAAKKKKRREKAAKREEEKREKKRLRKELAKRNEEKKEKKGATKKPWAGQAPVSSLFDSWGDEVIPITRDWPKLDELTEEDKKNLKLEFNDPNLSYLNIDLKQVEESLAAPNDAQSDSATASGSDSNPSEDNLNPKQLAELGRQLRKKRAHLRRMQRRRDGDRRGSIRKSLSRSLSLTNLTREKSRGSKSRRRSVEGQSGASEPESDCLSPAKRSVAFGRTTYVEQDLEKLKNKSKQLPLLPRSPVKLQRSCSFVGDERPLLSPSRCSPLRQPVRWSSITSMSRWKDDGCTESACTSPLQRQKQRVVDFPENFGSASPSRARTSALPPVATASTTNVHLLMPVTR